MKHDCLIIGTDINAYYMARCYHELYNRKAKMIGMAPLPFTQYSDICDITYEPNLKKMDVFIKILNDYARKSTLDKIILIGTSDGYVRQIVEAGEKLNKKFVYNYPKIELINRLLLKTEFYNAYHKKLELPKTFIYSCKGNTKIKDEFTYPVVLKPSNGVLYYKHPFENQGKVYKLNSFQEVCETIRQIENSGYDDDLIIQEFVPGGDSNLFDVAFYVGKDHKLKVMSFAQIALQERTHSGVGNCTVLMNGFSEFGEFDHVIKDLVKFIESIDYQGFGEFDLKYDERDGKYKVFEINPRQSRSGYYLPALGYNYVQLLVDDLIHDKPMEQKIVLDEILLSFVPKGVIFKYTKSDAYKQKARELIKAGKFVNPLKYDGDKNMKRKVYNLLRDINYYKKYKNLEW